MNAPELSRIVRVRPAPPRQLRIEATGAERAALAGRLGVVAVDLLVADVELDADGSDVAVRGTLRAEVTQSCAVAGDPFPVRIDEPLALRFVPEGSIAPVDEDTDYDSTGPDEIEFGGETFDLGEAVAQSLALAIDPYPEGPDADAVRRDAGIVDEDAPRGPLADALAALRRP